MEDCISFQYFQNLHLQREISFTQMRYTFDQQNLSNQQIYFQNQSDLIQNQSSLNPQPSEQFNLINSNQSQEESQKLSESIQNQESQANSDKTKTSQSPLHNCPKHLVKIISQVFNLKKSWAQNCFIQMLELDNYNDQVQLALKMLIKVFNMCSRKQIKNSISRQMLKIIFENGSQFNSKFKLNNTQQIKSAFIFSISAMNQAKEILRQVTIKKLIEKSEVAIQKSRVQNKAVLKRYIEYFIKQLRTGNIAERITKPIREQIINSKQ